LVGLAVLFGVLAGPLLAAEERNWVGEIGTEASYRDNFFFRADQGETPPPSATLATVFANGEVVLGDKPGQWMLCGAMSGNFTNDIENANYGTAEVGVEYKRRKTRGSIDLGYTPNRIFSEEADGTFFDLGGFGLGLRQYFGRGFWFGAEYEAKNWIFDPAEADRDAISQEIGAALRVPLGRRAGLRFFGATGTKEANSPDYDWDGDEYGLALEWSVSSKVNLFLRAKQRERDYPNAPVEDRNFERNDAVLDALMNLKVRVGPHWGLGFRAEYRDAESTRIDRNYDASLVGFGMFFVL
jgi:hypothetical protein